MPPTPEDGPLDPDVARRIMALDFPPEIHARHEILAAKAQEGTLTPEEAEEMDMFIHADNMLALLRLKARRSLGR